MAARSFSTRLLIAPLLLFVLGAAAAAAETTLTFDKSDAVKSWSFGNGPEFPGATGWIAWYGKDGHDRPGSLALHYSFVGGGNYVQAGHDLPKDNDFSAVRLSLQKPPGPRITFRVVDSGGQTFQKSRDFGSEGWVPVEVDLSTWDHSFGGAGNGKVRFPLRQFAVLVENTGGRKEDTVLIDDVIFLAAGSADHKIETGTYNALSDGHWHASGGGGNAYRDRVWTYAFTESKDDGPVLRNEFSLLGRPLRLFLEVDSDGSDHEVSVTLGSHFQHFRRVIGKLTAKGAQVLEAPLNDLSSWSHFGGENDGQRRLPLRMLEIGLKKGDGPTCGQITLKQLTIVTCFEPHEAVIIVPSVRGDGDGATFNFELRNLRRQPAQGELICEFRTLGERVGQEKIDLTLPGIAQAITRTLKAPSVKADFLEAVVCWREREFTSKPVSIGRVSLPGAAVNPGLEPESIIGAGLYLYRWNGRSDAFENIARTAEFAQRAGVKWSREEILWHVTEPEKGRFEWAFYDRMIEIAQQHGISIYGLLDYWSDWTKKDTEEGVEDYCRWARQVVRRYKDRIHHWEIWNEPNIFFWSGPKELYAKLLTKAYEAIKAEDPTAIVMGCSTAGIDTGFIKDVMKWGGKFDALTIHPYRGELEDVGFRKELQDVKALVDRRPVWITEIGFPSELVYGYSERNQASLVARVYLSTLASRAAANVSWYDFRNDGNNPFYNEHNFGLIRADFQPKPAYRALATLGRTLARKDCAGRIELGPKAAFDTYAYRFGGADGDTVAVCASQLGGMLAFEADDKLTIQNGMGEVIDPVRMGNLQLVTLDRGFPVYLSGPAGFTFKPVESPVKLTAGLWTRPGERVTLMLEGATEVSSWDLPFGWDEPKPLAAGHFELTVPANARIGTATLQAIIDGGKLRLPVTIRVQPAVIRL